jgi:hypothetical protein
MCTTDCKPALLTGQTFGLITTDGASYVPLAGSVVCATFLDSVQMWAPLDTLGNYGTWNWNNTWLTAGTYNNDSTMGLITHRRTIGFVDPPTAYPYLGKVAIDFWKTFLRYPGAPGLTNWRIGEFIDYDMGGDTALYFPDASSAVSVATGTRVTGTWGTMKLPFGGGCNSEVYPPLIHAIAMQSAQAMNSSASANGNLYFDSVYYIMGRPAGAYAQGVMAGADNRFHSTYATHTFADSDDTLEFAIAHFGDPTLANPKVSSSMALPLAKLLNKWMGMDRGDVNNDGALNLADIVYLADFIGTGQFGPIPFQHVGDVNVSGGAPTIDDVNYLVNYYFFYGPCPMSEFITY